MRGRSCAGSGCEAVGGSSSVACRSGPAIEALVNVMLDRQGETRAPHSSNLLRAQSFQAQGRRFSTSGVRVWACLLHGPTNPNPSTSSRILDDPSWMATSAPGSGTEHGIRRDCRGCTDPERFALTAMNGGCGSSSGLWVVWTGRWNGRARLDAGASEGGGDTRRPRPLALYRCGSSSELPGTTEADQAIDALVDCVCMRERDEQKAMAL